MGFGTAVPFNPPTITQEAAMKAAAGSGKRKIPDGVITNLAKKSRKMASEFQESMQKHVKKKLDSMSGPDDNRKRGLKVAQFIPGKGLEVPGTQLQQDPSIYCSLGLKGTKLVDALDKTFDTISGKQVSIDFAFKLICDPNLGDKEKKSRITVGNCFRHVNPDSFNYRKTGTFQTPDSDAEVDANIAWHSTLGPDASYIRRGPNGLHTTGQLAGTWRGTTTTGGMSQVYVPSGGGYVWDADEGEAKKANSLVSPYRYPNDMEMMYSRLNRQVLENYGFSLNRFRFVDSRGYGSSQTNIDSFTGSNYIDCYPVPSSALMNFPKTFTAAESDLKNSFPAQINNLIKPFTGDHIPSQQDTSSTRYEYHSQLGSGKLNYQFSNDGTNPVCIDLCVVGVKKGENVSIDLLNNFCTYNYQVNRFANNQRMNLNGYSTEFDPIINQQSERVDFDRGSGEWHSDAKLPFVPDECFKNPQSYVDAVNFQPGTPNPALAAKEVADALMQGKKNPFKIIKRDQFIVSSGATRAWNTTLPSIKYRPQIYEDIEYPLDPAGTNDWLESNKVISTADEYTFVLLVGASGISKPIEELYPEQTTDENGNVRNVSAVLSKTITDHEPSTCNVSVVGTYTELVKPAYPEDVSDKTFINGRLTLPYFTAAGSDNKIQPIDPSVIEAYPDRLAAVDISTQAQTVRVSNSGVSGVGAINTTLGA